MSEFRYDNPEAEKCQICHCEAMPPIVLTIPYGGLAKAQHPEHVLVCKSCMEDYEDAIETGHTLVCTSCELKVPHEFEWTSRDNDSGDYFCFRCTR